MSQTIEKHHCLNTVLKTLSYTMLHHLFNKLFQITEKQSFLNTVLKTPSYTNVVWLDFVDIQPNCFEDTKLYECGCHEFFGAC